LKSFSIRALMVPLSEYATVSEDATLYDAVMALEKAQEEFDRTKYRHRAILIMDKAGNVSGKISQLDVLRALEPKYEEMQKRDGLARFGFTKKFMQSLLDSYHLWDEPLADICKKGLKMPVSKFMTTPTEEEIVDIDATLDEGIHQMVLGIHQSLLVLEKGKIVGILRLTDVFAAVFHQMKECHI
jgi:CBS domain-containing protein